jgi:hypothetical protein
VKERDSTEVLLVLEIMHVPLNNPTLILRAYFFRLGTHGLKSSRITELYFYVIFPFEYRYPTTSLSFLDLLERRLTIFRPSNIYLLSVI